MKSLRVMAYGLLIPTHLTSSRSEQTAGWKESGNADQTSDILERSEYARGVSIRIEAECCDYAYKLSSV